MRGAKVGRSQSEPLRIIPAAGKVPENSLQPPSSERWDVLHVHELGSNHANDARELGPESGSFPVQPSSSPGDGYILARETAVQK